MNPRVSILLGLLFAARACTAELPDLALQAPRIITSPGLEYGDTKRGAQGVAALERSAGGRWWAAWFASASTERVETTSSYVVLSTSSAEGRAWSALKMVVQAPPRVRTYDPCLWSDPAGRLWLFWAQSAGMQDGRMGVWCMTTEQPDLENPLWTAPRRLAHGVMLNKPTVLNNGDWLLTVGHCRDDAKVPRLDLAPDALPPYTEAMLLHDLGEERGSNVYRSTDAGRTFERIGQVRFPGTAADEHMIVERRDGSLWMLLRNLGGIAQSVSSDGGRTWKNGPMFLTLAETASSRFFLRRLRSGALLLVRNAPPAGRVRTHLTAFLSDDDGATWQGGLVLDERASSYPDGVQAPGGMIHLIYDHERYTSRDGRPGAGAILLAVFGEADVRAGRVVSNGTRLKGVVSQLRQE